MNKILCMHVVQQPLTYMVVPVAGLLCAIGCSSFGATEFHKLQMVETVVHRIQVHGIQVLKIQSMQASIRAWMRQITLQLAWGSRLMHRNR